MIDASPLALPADVAKPLLRELIRDLAIVRGTVTLASGKTADYYVDLRRITLHHMAAPLVGTTLLDLLDRHGYGPAAAEIDADGNLLTGATARASEPTVAVGGLTLGADPVATALMFAAAAQGRSLDAFVVRKDAKAHGLQRRIEGPDVAGRRVVAVEDTSTTGGSVLTAVEALREAGANVAAVAVIVDRNTGAREAVEAAGLAYLSLFGLEDLGL